MKITKILAALCLIRSSLTIFGAAEDFDFGGGKRAKKTSKRLSQCENERRKQKKEIASMKADISGYRDLIDRLEKQVESLNNDNSALRDGMGNSTGGDNSQLTIQITNLKTQNGDLMKDNQNFAQQIEKLRVTIEQLRKNKGDCGPIEEEAARLRREVEAFEGENNSMVMIIADLTSKNKKCKKLASENHQLEVALDALRFDFNRITKENQDCSSKLTELSIIITQLEGRAANVETLQGEMSRLERIISDKDKTIRDLKNQITSLEGTIDELNRQASDASALTIIISKLEADLKNEKTVNIEIKSQVETLKSSLISLAEESDGKLQGRISELIEENDKLLKQLEGLRMTVSDLKKSLRVKQHNGSGDSSCKVQINSLKVEINKLTQVNTQLKKEISIIMGKGSDIVDANELMIGFANTNTDF